MQFQVKFSVNEVLYLKNPETSDIGRAIVKNGIELIHEIGFEQFTFKKLAAQMQTTEATVYRYFASKHKLLIYVLNWYWHYLELVAHLRTTAIRNARKKLETIIDLVTHSQIEEQIFEYDLSRLYAIVVAESSKAYLVKEIDVINQELVFNPLKELCGFIADCILAYKPDYPYARSLASTLLETAHDQQFFSEHLPKLTDNTGKNHREYVRRYLLHLLFNVLD